MATSVEHRPDVIDSCEEVEQIILEELDAVYGGCRPMNVLLQQCSLDEEIDPQAFQQAVKSLTKQHKIHVENDIVTKLRGGLGL
eukprot:468701-Karenia_brevis.AAC.1